MLTFLKNIKLKIKKFLKQAFCNHEYNFLGSINYYYYYDDAKTEKCDCSVDFFECKHCRKRIFVGNAEPAVYKNKTWKELKMWKKHELEIGFDNSNEQEPIGVQSQK